MLDELHLPHPEKNADVFQVLHDHHLLHHDPARRLKRLALFRNLIVHDYAGVDIERLQIVLRNDISDIEKFQE